MKKRKSKFEKGVDEYIDNVLEESRGGGKAQPAYSALEKRAKQLKKAVTDRDQVVKNDDFLRELIAFAITLQEMFGQAHMEQKELSSEELVNMLATMILMLKEQKLITIV